MTVFAGPVDATFAAFWVDALYTPAGGEPVSVRVIARRPDTIVGFGDTRIHPETATFEVRASEVADPRVWDQLTVGGETFVIGGERSGEIPVGSDRRGTHRWREPEPGGRRFDHRRPHQRDRSPVCQRVLRKGGFHVRRDHRPVCKRWKGFVGRAVVRRLG